MCYLLIVSIHKADNILLIEGAYIDALFVIQTIDKICILYYHHPFGFTFVYHIVCQTFLIIPRECILSIRAKLTIIWWIKENEIFLLWFYSSKELFKVKIIYFGFLEMSIVLRGVILDVFVKIVESKFTLLL